MALERLTVIGQNNQKGRCSVAAKADHEHCMWGDLLRNQSFPKNAESRIKQKKFTLFVVYGAKDLSKDWTELTLKKETLPCRIHS